MIDNPLPDQVMQEKEALYVNEKYEEHCADKAKELAEINNLTLKIDESINGFRFNVSIAYFYQVYKIFKEALDNSISNKVLKDCVIKIMKLMTPFTPHLSNECLELFKCDTTDKWPIIDKRNVLNEVKLAVQINGKTRGVIETKADLKEKDILENIKNNQKINNYIKDNNLVYAETPLPQTEK